jgi:hypothetical protein
MEKIRLETVQWHAMSNIDDVEPLSDADFDVLKDIRDVLRKHGCTSRFGVCLLHKHFELQPGEAALEESHEASRVSTIRVVPQESCAGAMETAWQFSANADISAGRQCKMNCKGFGMTGHAKEHSGTCT